MKNMNFTDIMYSVRRRLSYINLFTKEENQEGAVIVEREDHKGIGFCKGI